MIGFFADPYPDELLYSACARLSDRSNYRNAATVARELFGTASGRAVVAFPNRLAHLISVLPPGHKYTIDKLINKYTLLRYYSPFIDASRLQIVRTDMAADGENRILSRLGINAGRLRSPKSFRYCPQCVEYDRQRYKVAYWHRVHQLAGVDVCPDHLLFLKSSAAESRERQNSNAFVSAESVIADLSFTMVDPNSRDHQLLLKLAKDAQWLLNWNGTTLGTAELRERYYHLMLRKGLAYFGGRFRHAEFLRQFLEFYSSDFLESLQSLIGDQKQPWPLGLVRLNRLGQANPPLRHLLLMTFLDCTAEQFFTDFRPVKPFGAGPWPCLNRASDHYRENTITDCVITNGHKKQKSEPVGHFSCTCGFRYLRVGIDDTEADRVRFNKVISYGATWDRYLEEQWSDPNVTMSEIAHKLGVIPFTLKRHAIRLKLPFPRKGRWARPTSERIIEQWKNPARDFEAARNRHRGSWLSVRQRYPKAKRKQLILLGSYSYYWLWKHDGDWLEEHMPPPQINIPKPVRVCWAKWDKKFSKTIATVSADMKHRDGPPIRVSKEAIIKVLERRSWIEHYLDKLPETSHALQQHVESREEFLIRRVNWAELSFIKEDYCPTRHQLEVRAGTRTTSGSVHSVQEAIDTSLANLNRYFERIAA